MLDPAERYCHIEHIIKDDFSEASEVWKPSEWKNCYEKRLLIEGRKKEEREARQATAEIMERVISSASVNEPWSSMTKEQAEAVVRAMLRKRQLDKIYFISGVQIDPNQMLIV